MWFMYPEGTSGISVEQQNFTVEVTAEINGKTREFFRAPDHFAATILGLTGFTTIRPPGDHPDLPPTQITSAVSDLATQLDGVRSELSHIQATLAEVSAERDDLRLKNAELQAKIFDLENPEEAAKIDEDAATGPGGARSKK